jgi:hypothetical protein
MSRQDAICRRDINEESPMAKALHEYHEVSEPNALVVTRVEACADRLDRRTSTVAPARFE